MTFERPLLAILATVAFGVAAASAAVPAVEPSDRPVTVDTSLGVLELAAKDDDLTWYTVNRTWRDPFDPSARTDWTTRGDPGSQDSSFDAGQGESFSSQQNNEHDDKDPPCHC